ncbi:Putative rieske [2Fe-2S] iron-sulfur domain, rieske [2Fe-2S] iron-sulfur domain superfamily [Septoria linicola]|uniref:Rieske [2Fe-2S] iron-sulfur domain, rieske [2Fe-2S] iron-sulfur domain superfamily n=1 Tax=Septoria linicola TaxID=215465 RepID=A0A9Q9AHB1_9PEZI|nr:putative rieske [2Fe-2S] iron-sulfur domain, rieske [2Fe-2S] iron-sulfur domain superfamily [Septoria linicola]USW47664.1 Putative rieske [2Fe-2S] iron-sulfur domain, rieske [2Fe-2S] iron-sulfur domain superfamily [Septoria linicola]
MEPYRPPPKATPNPWIYAGQASSFTDIAPIEGSNTKLSTTKAPPDPEDIFASPEITTPCKIFQLAAAETSSAVELTPDAAQNTIGFQPQILVFRYRGQLHAIDHSCPHRNFPLSRGSLYDIEDFGVVLSAGVECPKHGWSFGKTSMTMACFMAKTIADLCSLDIHTGESDRGNYRLQIWEVEVRSGQNGFGETEEEVWVRRKEKKKFG